MVLRDRLRDAGLRLLREPAVRAHPGRGSLRLRGLTDRATVRRDDRGVPWVAADDERDLYFAVGFAQASDRLWQMDVLRRRARGRLAEVLGKPVLPEDVRARRLALDRVARRSLHLLDPESYGCLVAFSDGVNAAIRRLRRRAGLPVEFLLLRYRPDPWTPLDSVLIVKHLGFDLGTNLRQEIFRTRLTEERPGHAVSFFAPRYPADGAVTIRHRGQSGVPRQDHRDVLAPAPSAALSEESRAWLRGLLGGETFPGSNAWAISGRLTRSGAPLLANDPHVLFTQPSIWYQMGLRLSAGTTAYGITVPGLPGLIAGSNTQLAWGITNATVDTQDLCLLEGRAARPTWSQESVISVRGGEDVQVSAAGGDRHVEFDVPGPGDSSRFGLFWSGFIPSTEITSCLRMWRAESYPRFRTALRDFGVPVLNVVVATADDVIALKTAGNVPRRRPGSGLSPAPFDDVAESWQELLTFDELPETVNPTEGYVISANHKLVPDDARVQVGADWVAPYRAERIERLILGSGLITAEQCARWQNDVADGRAARVLPALLAALDARPPTDPLARAGHRLLSEWDGYARADQPAPLIFFRLVQALVERWVSEPLGTDLAASMPDLTLQLDHLILHEEARRELGETEPLPVVVSDALCRAIETIATEHGADPEGWRYDAVHRIDDRHPIGNALPALRGLFGGETTPVAGSGHSVCLMTPDRSGAAIEGAPWRFVAEVGPAEPILRDVLRHGSSGLPGSVHYDDQTQDHATGQMYLNSLAGPSVDARTVLTLLRSRWSPG
ncbi:penicillin acylase family protein [Micromonospora lutea]|nr:penicillin acylase family protein [Micromonospora lutea]